MHLPHAPYTTPSTCTLNPNLHLPPAHLFAGACVGPQGGELFLTVAFGQNWGFVVWIRSGVFIPGASEAHFCRYMRGWAYSGGGEVTVAIGTFMS